MEAIFLQMLEISITTSIMIFLLFTLAPVLNKRYAAKWKYWMWLILAVRLLIPINFTSSHSLLEISIPKGLQKTILESKNSVLSENTYVNSASGEVSDLVNQSVLPSSLSNSMENNGIQANVTEEEAAKNHQITGMYENNSKTAEKEQLQDNAKKSVESTIIAGLTRTLYSVTFLDVICGIWIIGIVCFMLYHSMSHYFYKKRLMRFCRPCDKKEYLTLYEKLCVEMHISKKPAILVNSEAQSPMLIGLIKSKLILPDIDYSICELRFILCHELMHHRRKDLWYKLLLLCANAVHWFNPFVYLMFREASGDLERFCDDEVVKEASFAQRRAYTETILNNLTRQKINERNLSTYFYGGSRRMKNRFQNILNTDEKKKGKTAFVLLLCSFLIMSSMIACGSEDENKLADENKLIVEEMEASTETSSIMESSAQTEQKLEQMKLEQEKLVQEKLEQEQQIQEAVKEKEEALKNELEQLKSNLEQQIEKLQAENTELLKLEETGQLTEENKKEIEQIELLIKMYQSELEKIQQEEADEGKVKRDITSVLYENDFLTFYYPAAWEENVTQSEDTNRIVFASSETASNEEEFWIQQGEAWLVDLDITAESYEEMWKETYPDIQVIRISDTLIDDYEAIEIVFAYTKDGKRYYGIEYQTIVEYASFQFHGSCLKTVEEDFKTAISGIIYSVHFLTEDSADVFDKIELDMAEQGLSGDALEVQQIVKDFSRCFFQGDLEGIKQYLWENYEWDVYVNEAVDVTTLNLKKIKGLSKIEEQKTGDECHVSLEYTQGNEDSNNYLEIGMIKTENGWKITSYGVEK